MKLRSALLIACMLVVPLLAMFSHKIPSELRLAARKRMWDALATALGHDQPEHPLGVSFGPAAPIALPDPGPASAAMANSAVPAAVDAAAFVAPSPLPPPLPQTLHSPVGQIEAPPSRAAIEPPAAEAAIGGSVPPLSAPELLSEGLSSESVVPLATSSISPAPAEAIEQRLRALGALSIEWTPSQAGDGLHRCSCRLPADPSGQLHRVFQASAADPIAALDSLLGQVTAWSMRASTPSPQGGRVSRTAAEASQPRR